MDPEDTRETAGDTEETLAAPPEPTENTVEQPRATLGSGINRRKFLAAAALGSAAAALVSTTGDGLGGFQLGPLSAFANDLSDKPCTAEDVEIIGAGIVVNEPCACTGTFDAMVQFTVRNNTSAGRYCIALHLPSGFGVPGQDVVLRRTDGQSLAEGKSGGQSFRETPMMGVVVGFPCGAGLVCIGQDGVTQGKCAPNTCTTIAWNTTPNAAGCTTADQNPPGGQCRHQQVCIQGRGRTTLDCDLVTTGVQTNCDVACGVNATLRLCTTSAPSLGPFTFTLESPSFPTQSVATAETCHDFTVGPITSTTTFTGTVTDREGCAKSASVTLTTTALATPVLSAGAPDCSGVVTFTVTNCDPTLTYTFQEVDCSTGTAIGTAQSGLGKCSATFTFPPGAADTTHCVRVTASNGNAPCDRTARASVLIRAAVTATLAVQGTPGCDGVVTLLATAGGGEAPFTFQFNGASGAVSGTDNTRTIVIQPQLNDACRSVTVTVTDARGCAATSAAVSFRQCVTTTFNC